METITYCTAVAARTSDIWPACSAEGRLTVSYPPWALHAGHMSPVRAATAQCRPVIVSIFVNPTQFAPNEDFQKYPRTLEADRQQLEESGVDYLFAPETAEMYPQGFRTWVNVDGLPIASKDARGPSTFEVSPRLCSNFSKSFSRKQRFSAARMRSRLD